MKKTSTLLTALIIFISIAMGQQTGKISGSIVKDRKPAEGATVSILNGKDSLLIKALATGKDGLFAFENLSYGQYILAVTSVGYQKRISRTIEINTQRPVVQFPPLPLIPESKDMNGVTVIAKRPPIEQKIDRAIVNVDASITNAGTSALEVLEKSPGVTVDQDGNISLKGKDGVMIMVDGKPTHLSGPDLANMLRNMSSNQLDQIEIMTNPPVRYDAAGTSGLINIKTKKLNTRGYNGSGSVAFNQGRYPKVNEGFNFNYRENKINLFTNLAHDLRKTFSDLTIQRKLLNGNTNEIENYFDQHAHAINGGHSFNAKIGLDFFASKKTTFGMVVNGTTSPSSSANSNTTDISNSLKLLENVIRANVANTTKWKSSGMNLNFRTVLDKKGTELTSDMDLLSYRYSTRLFMSNSYEDAGGTSLGKADTLAGDLPQQIYVYSGKIDYLQNLNRNSKFEAGIKASVVKTDNNASYDSIQNSITVHDDTRSNHFIYRRKIQTALHAAIPYSVFQYKSNDKNTFSANFGRRVRHPSYASLNPFIRFIDRYTYTQGNPNLKPSLSNNFEVSYTWKNRITSTINYTSTTDIIEDVIDQKNREAYRHRQTLHHSVSIELQSMQILLLQNGG